MLLDSVATSSVVLPACIVTVTPDSDRNTALAMMPETQALAVEEPLHQNEIHGGDYAVRVRHSPIVRRQRGRGSPAQRAVSLPEVELNKVDGLVQTPRRGRTLAVEEPSLPDEGDGRDDVVRVPRRAIVRRQRGTGNHVPRLVSLPEQHELRKVYGVQTSRRQSRPPTLPVPNRSSVPLSFKPMLSAATPSQSCSQQEIDDQAAISASRQTNPGRSLCKGPTASAWQDSSSEEPVQDCRTNHQARRSKAYPRDPDRPPSSTSQAQQSSAAASPSSEQALDRIVRRTNLQARRRETYPEDLDHPFTSSSPAQQSSAAASRDSSSEQALDRIVRRANHQARRRKFYSLDLDCRITNISPAQRSSATASRESSLEQAQDRIVCRTNHQVRRGKTYPQDRDCPPTSDSPAQRSSAAASRDSSSEQAQDRIVRRMNHQVRRVKTYPQDRDCPTSDSPAHQSSAAASRDSSSEQAQERMVRRTSHQVRRGKPYPQDRDCPMNNSPAQRSSVAASQESSSEQTQDTIASRADHQTRRRKTYSQDHGTPAASSSPSRRYSKLRCHRLLPPVPQWIIAALSKKNAKLTNLISTEAFKLHSTQFGSMPEGLRRKPLTILKDACVNVRLAAKRWLIAARLIQILQDKAETSRVLLNHSRVLFRKCVPKLFASACLIRLYHQVLRRNFLRAAFAEP